MLFSKLRIQIPFIYTRVVKTVYIEVVKRGNKIMKISLCRVVILNFILAIGASK